MHGQTEKPDQGGNGASAPDLGEAIASLSEDLKQLRSDFGDLKQDVGRASKAGLHDARARAKDTLGATEEAGEAVLDTALSEFAEIKKQVEKAVRKNPGAAIATAVAIGFFLNGAARR